MTRGWLTLALVAGSLAMSSAQTDTYDLVTDWAKLPQGWVLGHPQAFPLPAERDQARAMQEKQRAEAIARGETPPPRPRETLQPGVSGVAVDANDNVYVLHRGKQPILVFDRGGKLLRSGGGGIIGSTPHFIEVDRHGNVWAVDEAAHRVLKFNQALDKVVLQIGVTNEPGHDATHLNLPADIAFTKSGDILIADGYGNNRIAKFSPDGKFLKQWGGGPDDRGTADGQFHLPHAVVVDPNDRVYVVDRENLRIQMFDTDGKFLGKFTHLGRAWGLALSHDGKFGFITEHDTEQVVKFSTADGKVAARWGSQGRGPNQFDWAHGIAVDSRGGVYVGDTYGQRLQKFIPRGSTTTSAQRQ
jgi:DNA-binding beta-propeller fold protein YncE